MTKFGTGPGWKRVQRPLATALLCGAMLTSLTGCIELMVGGAVMGGVAAADRRTLGAQNNVIFSMYKCFCFHQLIQMLFNMLHC